jgi:hypothetical protein
MFPQCQMRGEPGCAIDRRQIALCLVAGKTTLDESLQPFKRRGLVGVQIATAPARRNLIESALLKGQMSPQTNQHGSTGALHQALRMAGAA